MTVPANINRANLAGLIPELYSNQILETSVEYSTALRVFPRIQLPAKSVKYPVLSVLPTAGWVTETVTDATGVKPKSKVEWRNKYITAEELAVIVPIHENVIEDSTINLWGTVRPLVAQAIGQKIDEAIFFGLDKPESWPEGIVPDAIDKDQVVEMGEDLDLIDSFNESFGLVEAQGMDVSDVFAGPRMKWRLRGLRDENGNPQYSPIRQGTGTLDIFGVDFHVLRNGTWDETEALAAFVDRSKILVGVRSDMEYKMLDQATLGTGADAINLAERDMVALRVKMRLGWVVADNATALTDEPVPYAVLLDGSAGS